MGKSGPTTRSRSSCICPAFISTSRKALTVCRSWENAFRGKGQRVIGRIIPTGKPFRPGGLHRIQSHAGRAPESDHHEFGPFEQDFFPALLLLLDLAVFFSQVLIQLNETGVVKRRRIDHLPRPIPLPSQSPGLGRSGE